MRHVKPFLPSGLERQLRAREPVLWINKYWIPLNDVSGGVALNIEDVYDAERRLRRCSTLLSELFPELRATDGIIESPLIAADGLRNAMMDEEHQLGHWFVKGDHALPIAGSIKARGGIYEVLLHAENLALRRGLMAANEDTRVLASPQARKLFSQHQIAVGSTGNLGLSIGLMAAALGFRAVVHMSADAKDWKKACLRAHGVEVVEHAGDFSAAVAAGRRQAQEHDTAYFVDDEKSKHLFLGYSVAAIRLRDQLGERGIEVNSQRPLFVYLPCGVGGAPGGITFGLRHLLGDHVHCFFAEPVASPCMLIRLASTGDCAVSVGDIGLDNRTHADGLAVGQASEFAAPIVKSLVSGVFTVRDCDLYEDLYMLKQCVGLCVEPSAAAGCRGPYWLLRSAQGRRYLERHGIADSMSRATHIVWTTGGAFLPKDEYQHFHDVGQSARTARMAGQSFSLEDRSKPRLSYPLYRLSGKFGAWYARKTEIP
jgi:D-serine dehydratase